MLSKLLRYLYVLEYDVVEPTRAKGEIRSLTLTIHASLYIISDKYGVQGLKTIAKNRFGETLRRSYSEMLSHGPRDLSSLVSAIAPSIETIYAEVPSSEDPLRLDIQSFFQENVDLFIQLESFKDLIASIPDLSYGLLMHAVSERPMLSDHETAPRGRQVDDRPLWVRRAYSNVRQRDPSPWGTPSDPMPTSMLEEMLRLAPS